MILARSGRDCLARILLFTALILLANQATHIPPVDCYTSRKFLTGFLIALLLANKGQSHYGSSYATASYSPPAYPRGPQIYVIPTLGGY